jgi:hypothetical protein
MLLKVEVDDHWPKLKRDVDNFNQGCDQGGDDDLKVEKNAIKKGNNLRPVMMKLFAGVMRVVGDDSTRWSITLMKLLIKWCCRKWYEGKKEEMGGRTCGFVGPRKRC